MGKTKMILILLTGLFCISTAFAEAPQNPATESVKVEHGAPIPAGKTFSETKAGNSCSCKSGDGKKQCSVSCKSGESAYCDCDETSASCTCN